jgi:regulatory protein
MPEDTLYKTALSRSMNLCSQREYCVDEIRNKLHLWGIGDRDCDRIINTLVKENFINEIRYADAFVSDKFRYNKWGKVKIAAHLRNKQIPQEIIVSALESIDNELYKNTIKEIIISHRRSVKAKNQYDLKGKLLRYGLSKGFESNLLYDILNDPEEP